MVFSEKCARLTPQTKASESLKALQGSVCHESLSASVSRNFLYYEVPTAINKHIIMASAAVPRKAKKGLRSNSSSSTESVNSIPASSDEEAGPPIMLDEVAEKVKKKKKVSEHFKFPEKSLPKFIFSNFALIFKI